MSSMSPKRPAPLVSAEGLTKHFPLDDSFLSGLRGSRSYVRAVDGISLEVHTGETLAIVGESGSGKSTLGRLLLRLIEPTAGRTRFKGEDIYQMSYAELRKFRRNAQIILQDPMLH